MNYIIHTPSAARLKKEIIERVEAKVDAKGKGIATWQAAETDGSEKVLVHTTDQWAEKGCIAMKQELGRNVLQVRFYYWDSCEERNNEDDKIMLGRFTELLLVHFSYFVDKITIE
jgi:hypothetical protein